MPLPPDVPKRIAEKMDIGSLPRTVKDQPLVGTGTGFTCAGCDTSITSMQIEWTFETLDGHVLRLHIRCASEWNAERRNRGWL